MTNLGRNASGSPPQCFCRCRTSTRREQIEVELTDPFVSLAAVRRLFSSSCSLTSDPSKSFSPRFGSNQSSTAVPNRSEQGLNSLGKRFPSDGCEPLYCIRLTRDEIDQRWLQHSDWCGPFPVFDALPTWSVDRWRSGCASPPGLCVSGLVAAALSSCRFMLYRMSPESSISAPRFCEGFHTFA